MTNTKKNTLFAIVAFILALIAACVISGIQPDVHADTIGQTSNYNFTVLTDGEGSQSYSISIKATAKPSVETIIIPSEYNGLPVTEIANNGFMSCAKLKNVYLPTTVKKIGNNAFMNCDKLTRVGVEFGRIDRHECVCNVSRNG